MNNNKMTLINLLEETQLSKSDLKKKFYPYLLKKNDMMIVKMKFEEIANGNLENISDDDAIELIKILGGEVQETPKQPEMNKIENQVEKNNEEERRTLSDLYNVTMVENEKLREQNKKTREDYTKVLKENELLAQRLERLERIFDTLKQYNVTETAELIEVADEEINELYLKYLTEQTTKNGNAILLEIEDKIIMPKTYYEVVKGGRR